MSIRGDTVAIQAIQPGLKWLLLSVNFLELSCCCRLVVCGSGSVRCAMVRGDGGWSHTTTVTHKTTDHPPTTSICCVDVWLHRQDGGGENVGKKRAVCGAKSCIVLVHVCVAPCAGPYCHTLPQSAVPTHPPAGTNKAHTCDRRCVRRMASDLAGRGRSSRRLHSTQRHQRCVPNGSEGAGG